MTQCDLNQLATIYEIINANPGKRAIGIVSMTVFSQSHIYKSMLHQMEEHGFLLSQDERGGLYVFKAINGAAKILEARHCGKCHQDEVVKVDTARVVMR